MHLVMMRLLVIPRFLHRKINDAVKISTPHNGFITSPHFRMESWNVGTGCWQWTGRVLSASPIRRRSPCSSRPAPGSSWRWSPGWAPSCSPRKQFLCQHFALRCSRPGHRHLARTSSPNDPLDLASGDALLWPPCWPKDHITRFCHLCLAYTGKAFVHSLHCIEGHIWR